MTTLFWLALVLGGGLALLSLFGDVLGLDGDSGGADLELQDDAGLHLGQHDGLHILSLRSATYFLFAFGAVGVLLDWVWAGGQPWLTLLAALGTGAAAGVFSAYLFRWVTRTASGAMPADSTLVGLTGQMVLRIERGSGKVLLVRGGREHELLARPFDPDAQQPETWQDVIVIDVVDGTALVAPLDAQSRATLSPTSSPQEQ